MSMMMRGGSLFKAAGRNGSLFGPGKVVTVQDRGMANLKAVRNRMRSVSSISKITKAMKMVAAAKLRGVQTKQELARPFSKAMADFFKHLEDSTEGAQTPTAASGEPESKKKLIIPMTSDRGLCGGVNSSVVKEVKAMYRTETVHGDIMLVGDKGRDALTRVAAKDIVVSFKDAFKTPPTFTQVCVIAEEILSRPVDTITIVYNQFKSVISQIVKRQVVYGLSFLEENAARFDEYEFETDLDGAAAFRDLYEFQLATQLYSAMLENSTSEQAARMSAMDNATNNAKDMLGRLTLTYNRQRQAVITSELIEIISGAEALKG
uniref:ATP synthase subunit gamma, mitochondrial n=1 Tax=Rhodosorus marinus TaxID=101924 RepID=A0A7S2ZZ81_9RHOD|mmetsp:Transcript_35991/g.143901  ORF Transcript_35991/g.143901 Transcript_35991/m.143901 type:complete len:320 (+) Transcript_35991:91-1050(+)